ncbi:CvpA family protein [Pseudoxanthomonas sacheonensis]|uniref:CvpA family protein n=1 Tax=Pseudoxanthomonas sacheonensis TaxID=443615 RepID=UPI0013D14AB2|nr:CvpA family protein [Pseudoxanthomonas sacheonensis]KAF1706716.1 colicin V synthesis protein [Pseudoxanthomonas sacheonensis]
MIDIVLLIIIGGSALLGLIRGLVGTLVSTAAWLLAGWVTFEFGGQAAFWLSDDGRPTMTELFGGYALSFVVVMVVVALIGALAKSMVRSVGLSGVDRMLGAGLGLLRGAFLACILVLLMGFTPLPSEPSWRQSSVLPVLLPAAGWMRSKLPDWSVPEMDFRNALGSGDNVAPDEASGPLLDGVVQQVIDKAKGGVSQRQAVGSVPAGKDPANIEAGGQEPANIEASGQAPASGPANLESSKRPNGQKRPNSQ